jgi:branched-chain amino acid transport system permease protein
MAGSIYVMVAMGLTLILSILGMLQLAHGEIYMLGGYATYYFSVVFGLNFFLALLCSIILIGGFGIILEALIFRPFRRAEFFRSVIMATGLMLILQTGAVISFGSSNKVVTTPFPGSITVAGVSLSWERLIIILVSAAFVAALFFLINKTRIGQAMVAVSQDVDAASLQGINPNRVSSLAMFIGCALAAAAGGLMGAIFFLSPGMGGFALMKGIAVIILGGLGSLTGAVAGGLILGLVDGIVPPFLSTHLASLVGFILIILILLFKPQGLLGHASK